MTDKDKRMELPKISLDDLFTTQEQRDAEDYVIPIPLEQIDDFPNHPYKVRDDDKMKELSESIKTYGVSQPVIVRKKEDRIYIEKGNSSRLGDVAYFTFEPHISIPGSKYGYKKENIYYFKDGKIEEL